MGKTTLVNRFAESFKYFISLNLEKPEERSLFTRFKDVKTFIDSILISRRITYQSLNETLLFIDEVQESPEAIGMLRYFYEELPQLNVIAAGSLLEFSLKNIRSFPVGRVEYLYLHPLNFEEYLNAMDHRQAVEQLNAIPIKPSAHHVLLDIFNRYAIIGGMPEIVRVYLNEHNLTELPGIYESIWGTYQKDVEKYSRNRTEKQVIKHILSCAHYYVDRRIKFQNFGNSNYRSREVGKAMRSLDAALVIRLIYPTTDIGIPIRSDLKKSPRLQFLDTGIVNYSLGIQADMLAIQDLSNAYKGAIIPHLVNQELVSLNEFRYRKPNFWVSERANASSEVDLVYSCQAKVIPVEIKSGSAGKLRSLHQFIERTDHPYAIRLYAGEFRIDRARTPGGVEYLLMNLPYYLGTKIPEYAEYFVNNYSL